MSEIQPVDIYKVIDIVGKNWNVFVRTKLELTEIDIDNCEYMERDLREVRYQMVETWRLREGNRATTERLYQMTGYQSPESQQSHQQQFTENPAARNMQSASVAPSQDGVPYKQSSNTQNPKNLKRSPIIPSQKDGDIRGASGISKDVAPVKAFSGGNTPEHQRKNSEKESIHPMSLGHTSSSEALPIPKPKKTGKIKEFVYKFIGKKTKPKAGRKLPQTTPTGHLCDPVKWGKVDPVTDEDLDVIRQSTNRYPTEVTRGCVLILNNSFSNDKWQREGAHIDVNNMTKLWSQIGCDIYKGAAQQDKTAEEMKSLLKQMTVLDTVYSYVVIVIMTHGESVDGSVVFKGSDKHNVSVNEIENIFNNKNAPRLMNIPKFFIFQFCRGAKLDFGVQTDYKEIRDIRSIFERMKSVDDLPQHDVVRADGGKVPTSSDMHFAYATHDGQTALRNPNYGSWFITAITNVFMEHARREDVHLLLLRVHEAMKSKSGIYKDENKDTHQVYAMSWSGGSLTKRLFLLPGYQYLER